jgi:hypothetical protein
MTTVINADDTRSTNLNRIDPRIDPAFDPPKRILALNPIAAIGSIITPNAPFRPISKADLQLFPSSQLFGGDPRTYYGAPSSQTPQSANALARKPVLGYELPLWVGYLLVGSAIFFLFVLLSIFTLRTKRSKLPKVKGDKEGKKIKKRKEKTPSLETQPAPVETSLS